MSNMSPSLSKHHGVFAFITQRPVAVTMLVLAVLVSGLISMKRLPLTLMPDISYPSITLRTSWEGAAPEEVEQFVSRPIEQAMGVVAGKVSISSLSRAGQSDVVVEFGWNSDMDLAIQDLREKLEMVRLPDGVERPLILRYDPALDPVLRVGLCWEEGEGDEAAMRSLRLVGEDQIKLELEKLPGVAAVKVRGGLEEEIRVELEEAELSLRGLDIQAITSQLAAENINLAGGNLKEGRAEYVVRVLSEFKSLEDIARTRIRTRDGAFVQLGDLARILRAGKDPESLTRVMGKPAVEIEIHKEADANVVQVAKQLRIRLFGPDGRPHSAAEDSLSAAALAAKKGKPGPGGPGQGRGPEGAGMRMGPDPLEKQLRGQGIETILLADQSTFIEGSLKELRATAIQGGLLAVLILFLFLRSAAPTLIIALAIPLSIIATFGPMQLSGLSLNVMSLGGLALGIGMLVDNSIVVLESIHRCRQDGDDRLRAAIRGTGEVGQAVIASTLTTVAVFFPMVFVEGVAGQVFGDLALVVVYSLCASLILSLTVIPMLAALGAGRLAHVPGEGATHASRVQAGLRSLVWRPMPGFGRLRRAATPLNTFRRRGGLISKLWRTPTWLLIWPLLAFRALIQVAADLLLRLLMVAAWLLLALTSRIGGLLSRATSFLGSSIGRGGAGLAGLARAYPKLLGKALDAPGALVVVIGALLILAVVLLPRLGRELMPALHQGEFYVEAELPVGTPLERTAERLAGLEAFLKEQPEVAGLALVVGADTQGGIDTEGGEHKARLTVRLRESRDPRHEEQILLSRLRPWLARQPELSSRISQPVLFSYRTPVEVQIAGHDLAQLKQSVRMALATLSMVPGLADLHSGSGGGNPEIHVRFRREELNRLGLDLQDVGRLLRGKVLGNVQTEFRDVEQRIDIRVRLRPEDLLGLEDIRGLIINPGQQIPVPLSAVADVVLSEGPNEIRRVEQERTALIRANLTGRDLGSTQEEIRERLATLDWPEDQRWEVTGQSREMDRSLSSLYLALGLAVFLVYVVMASQFESLLHPLVILAAIPLAFLGVIPILALFGIPLSVLFFLGAIILVGIVVNNAIILVDAVNQQRARGLERRAALVRAGEMRLRPILMTTLTTVLGLLPMALGLGDGAELRRPMALTVIVGLSTSTLLTLFVIPVLYNWVEQGMDQLRAVKARPAPDEVRP